MTGPKPTGIRRAMNCTANQETLHGQSLRKGHGLPLLPVRGVMALVDLNEDQVLELIEDGRLAWSWNLALNGDAGAREIRVLPAAVADYAQGKKSDLGWDSVLRLVLPSDALTVSTVELARAFNVSSTHVVNLQQRKEFSLALKPAKRCGPGSSAEYLFLSVVEFLKRRRN
jgi:hypothetical protein